MKSVNEDNRQWQQQHRKCPHHFAYRSAATFRLSTSARNAWKWRRRKKRQFKYILRHLFDCRFPSDNSKNTKDRCAQKTQNNRTQLKKNLFICACGKAVHTDMSSSTWKRRAFKVDDKQEEKSKTIRHQLQLGKKWSAAGGKKNGMKG